MNTAIANEVLQKVYQMNALLESGMSPEEAGAVMTIQIEGNVENLGVDQAALWADGSHQCCNGENLQSHGGADHQCEAREYDVW